MHSPDVQPDRLRSRKEIMEEVVAKSKAMKVSCILNKIYFYPPPAPL